MKYPTCAVCGQLIFEEPWQATFTAVTNSSTHHNAESHFYFHEHCYEKGKTQLLGQLGTGNFPVGAYIDWDARDGHDTRTQHYQALSDYTGRATKGCLGELFGSAAKLIQYGFIILIVLIIVISVLQYLHILQ